MQCPLCASEIDPATVACPSCGAIRVTGASPLGVMVGGVGIVVAICVGCLWAALLALPLLGMGTAGFPWLVLVFGTAVAAGMLWFSRSTRQPRWIRRL